MSIYDEWSMSGPEEGDECDLSVFVTDSFGNEIVSIHSGLGAEINKELGRQIAKAMNQTKIKSPLKQD